jgi:membrane protein implicated in regulation of membrane protease activity
MSETLLWWIGAGLVVGAELLTGTVYLLLLSIGMAAAGWTARMGAPPAKQMLVCAVVGGLAMALLWQWRRHQRRAGTGQASSTNDLDIGQRVHVNHWPHGGLATVHYRGAPWQAEWTRAGSDAAPPTGPGDYAIVAVNGPRLVLGPLDQP